MVPGAPGHPVASTPTIADSHGDPNRVDALSQEDEVSILRTVCILFSDSLRTRQILSIMVRILSTRVPTAGDLSIQVRGLSCLSARMHASHGFAKRLGSWILQQ